MKMPKENPAPAGAQQKIWLMSFSYEIDAAEDIAIDAAARKRFSRSGDESFVQQSVLFFLISVIVFLAVIELSRHYAPFFDTGGGILLYYLSYLIAFLPTGAILLACALLYLWMLARRRRQNLRDHVTRGWRDIEIHEDGIRIMEANADHWLEWAAIRNVSHTRNEVVLDLSVTALHIPKRAFADKMDFLTRAKEIRKLWHDWLMRAAAEHDAARLHEDGRPSETERL